MCGEGLDVLKQGTERKPRAPEIGLILDVIPCDPMQVRETETLPRWPDQAYFFMDDPGPCHFDDPNRAGAVTIIVGRFEIESSEYQFAHPLDPFSD
jgi:hypothetical protein